MEKKEKKKNQKGEKSGYVMRKNTGMKVLRVLFWGMLAFVFVRGVVSILKPDKEEAVSRMISEFRSNYSDFTNQNNEVMSFAQNFVNEYLTYSIRGEEDYKRRLEPYVASSVLSSHINDLTAAADAIYVQAYRMEDYSQSQKDVYVLAEVEYTTRKLEADQTYTAVTSRNQLVLKVPVYCEGGAYIVENLPLIVSDAVNLEKYVAEEYYGTTLEDSKAAAVETSVQNFLKAYFEQDESVINYYLATSADKEAFSGLHGRFAFLGIDAIKSYQDAGGDIVCLVEFQVQDSENNVKMLQKINLAIQENGGRYYITAMNARTGNLNIK